ncbi:MAG: cyclase family protein [Solirubrobacterales bacterium]
MAVETVPVEGDGTAPLGGVALPHEVVDLSQPISAEMAGWRGSERAEISVEEVAVPHSVPGARISATYMKMVAHAGTHVDAARHFFPRGRSIDQYPAERFVSRGVAIDVPREGPQPLGADELAELDPGIQAGDAVLLHFGYAARYTGEDYYDHPYLSTEATDYLVERQIGLLGADLITPDMPSHRRPQPFDFPVHSRLLSADVMIVENLGPGLERVVGREFLYVMAPFTIPGADASPVVPLALLPAAGLR